MATTVSQPKEHASVAARPLPADLNTGSQRESSREFTFISVLALTLLAGAIRLIGSTTQSLRMDEGFSIRWSSFPLRPLVQGSHTLAPSIFQAVSSDVHPIGYMLMLHFWMQGFGANLATLRLPSEVAGTLAVPALYLFARTLYERRVALLATLIGVASPFWIWHAQEARMYPFLLLFTMVSSYGLLKALNENLQWGWALYFVASLLAIYTQYFAFLVLVAQGLFVLLNVRRWQRRQLAVWIGLQALMAILYLPWVHEVLQNYHGASDPSLVTPDQYTGFVLFSQFLFGYLSTPTTSATVAAWPLLVPAGLALGVFGAGASRRAIFLWMMLLVPIVFAFVVTLTVRPFISVRYLIVVTPALYILLAVALARISSFALRAAMTVALVGLMLISWRVEETNAGNPAMEDYRTAVTYIEQHSGPQDAVALDAFFNQDAYMYNAHNNLPLYGLPPSSTSQLGGSPLVSQPALGRYINKIVAGRKHLWVIYFLEQNNDPTGQVRHYLDYHTAGHAVILGGPDKRDQPQDPASYRRVQLVRYDLIPQQATTARVRPETLQQYRALAYLSPTPKTPYAPPFGRPGTTFSTRSSPVAMPLPSDDWSLRTLQRTVHPSHLDIFNENASPVSADVSVTLAGGTQTHTVHIPANSTLELRAAPWRTSSAGASVSVHASKSVVVDRSWIQHGSLYTQYGLSTRKGL